VRMFVEAIASVLAAGRAHLTDKDGCKPADDDPSVFGWRKSQRKTLMETRDEWSPQGDRIGWLVGEQVWLLPDESMAAVNRLLHEQGRSIPVSRNSLGKRLREQEWLTETDKDTFTKKVRLGGGRYSISSRP